MSSASKLSQWIDNGVSLITKLSRRLQLYNQSSLSSSITTDTAVIYPYDNTYRVRMMSRIDDNATERDVIYSEMTDLSSLAFDTPYMIGDLIDDILTLPTNTELNFAGEFTIMQRVAAKKAVGGVLPYIGNTTNGFQWNDSTLKTIYIAGNSVALASYMPSSERMYNIAIDRNSNNVVAGYVNGIPVTAGTQSGTMSLSAATIGTGFYLYPTNFIAFFNTCLTTEEKNFIFNRGVPSYYLGANTNIVSSGTLDGYVAYEIVNFVAGDDFSNLATSTSIISGTVNTTGCKFISWGTTPTVWTNSSQLRRIGVIALYNYTGIGSRTWIDASTNNYHLTVSGNPNLRNLTLGFREKEDTGVFTTNIASGISNKDLTIPTNASIMSVTCANTLSAGDITDFQCIADPTGDNITLLSGKTIANGKITTFTTIGDHNVNTTTKTLRFNATGNGAGGIRITVTYTRRY